MLIMLIIPSKNLLVTLLWALLDLGPRIVALDLENLGIWDFACGDLDSGLLS